MKAVKAIWLGLLSIITILPFNDLLNEWNQRLKLPDLFSSVKQWMQRKKQESELLTNQLVAFDSPSQLFIDTLVIGFIASLGEEVFFRGVIQRKLIDWTTNNYTGIWLTAILFSTAHFQFYGFFPRLLLGVLFGYLYIWSGNLWVSILAHFINNSLVTITIYFQRQLAQSGSKLIVGTSTWFWESLSIIGSAVVLFYFFKLNPKQRRICTK